MTAAAERESPRPEDWARRYAELTADAGRSYDRVLRRYNELLARVASGELTPESVQNDFRLYFQEQSTSSTRELVEASVGLLAGLLYVEAKYRETMLDGLLPPDGPIPPPPSPSSIDVTNWFQALARYGAEQSSRAIARQQRLVERIASGELSAETINEHGRRYLAVHAPRFVGDVVELGLKFARDMQRSSAGLAEGLYDRVLGPEPVASGAPDSALIVDLRGESGSVVGAEIEVENARAVGADVRCSLSEFVSRASGETIVAGDVTPARFTLAPGETRDVAVRLSLDRTAFKPGTDYFGVLRVAGAGEREMIVQLIAHADPAEVAG